MLLLAAVRMATAVVAPVVAPVAALKGTAKSLNETTTYPYGSEQSLSFL